jgi:glycine cleavage system H protein
MNFPENLKYTKEHEWIRVEGNKAWIGVTDFAQSELGDIVFVEIQPHSGLLNQGAIFGTVEAVKTVSDLYMPVAGTSVEVNAALDGSPESVNQDPYGAGWMICVEMSDTAQLNDLMDAAVYSAMVGA